MHMAIAMVHGMPDHNFYQVATITRSGLQQRYKRWKNDFSF